MIMKLPGSTIQADLSGPGGADAILSPLFLTGGLTLSQVVQLTGLEPYVIQNWVKRGFLTPPQHKKYSRRQFCRILLINMLKDSLQLEKICQLLSYVNGHLDDERDDIIDDSLLYLYVVRLVVLAEGHHTGGGGELERWCDQILEEYGEPVPGARERVDRCLQVMLTAYLAACLKREAEEMLAGLDLPAVKPQTWDPTPGKSRSE